LIGDALSGFKIDCNQSDSNLNLPITWIKTIKKVGTYIVGNNDSEISISSNKSQLNFASLKLVDEEYYACGYLDNNRFQLFNNYFLFIRG
jgi:hypothetical protein